jgi:putative endonuclease
LPADTRRAATGREGEDAAARYLEAQGCRVLARNWRANPGEIDIVAECPPPPGETRPTLAFVEVRTRSGEPGLAEESITERKAASMAAAAYAYMLAHDIDPESTLWRIDLIAVTLRANRIFDLNWSPGVL